MAFPPTLQCQWGRKICKKRRQNFLSKNELYSPLFKIQVESEFHLHQQDTRLPLQSTCLPRQPLHLKEVFPENLWILGNSTASSDNERRITQGCGETSHPSCFNTLTSTGIGLNSFSSLSFLLCFPEALPPLERTAQPELKPVSKSRAESPCKRFHLSCLQNGDQVVQLLRKDRGMDGKISGAHLQGSAVCPGNKFSCQAVSTAVT